MESPDALLRSLSFSLRLKESWAFGDVAKKTITEEKKSHREVKGARSTKKKNFHRDVIFSASWRDFFSIVMRQKWGSLGAFACLSARPIFVPLR